MKLRRADMIIKRIFTPVILFILFSLGSLSMKGEENVTEEEKKPLVSDVRITGMIDNTHVLYSGSDNPKDSLSRLLNIFYYDQFRHFQDPRAPYFMFMSKKGDLALGVGGQVKIRGYFDWNGSIPTVGFIPYDIPIPKDPTSMRALSASPSGTGLFFTLLGNNKLLGNFMAYFQADFSGYNNRGFRIKKAYITIKEWTAGYAVSTFEDTQAEPSTVDGAGPNGINSRKNVLVRYFKSFKKHWAAAGSVEFPSESISADGIHTASCTPYIPDFAAFIQYQWDNASSHLRLSGLLRTLVYRDLVKGQNHNITGWGVQLSTVINPTPSMNLFGIISTGRGHASYTTDLGNGDFDLIPVPDKEGQLYAPWAAGLVLGVQYYFTPKIFSNIAFSEQTYYPKRNPKDTYYRYGLYAVGNVFWDITPRLELGLEYLHGKRMNFNGESGSADRIMAMFMVSF
ncbi:MAG: hypothetical protein J1F16_03400 [Muribaculaceae bacterium]|nr:hypothetical protein [Muribaculaceae bacterium]